MKRYIPVILIILVMGLTLALVLVNRKTNNKQTTKQSSMKTYTTKPEMSLEEGKSYSVILKTSEGDITIELNSKETPITVNNFVTLAKDGFYDGVIFHRIIKGFMIQGGDPTGTGMGGPGYQFDDEKVVGEYTRGTVAMANAGPNTNGSQFFIMHKDVPLQKDYVIFGKVTQGIEVVDKIANLPVKAGGENSSPVNPPIINSVEVIVK